MCEQQHFWTPIKQSLLYIIYILLLLHFMQWLIEKGLINIMMQLTINLQLFLKSRLCTSHFFLTFICVLQSWHVSYHNHKDTENLIRKFITCFNDQFVKYTEQFYVIKQKNVIIQIYLYIWRVQSSGIKCHVVRWKPTGILGEQVTSIITVKESAKQETSMKAGGISQKTEALHNHHCENPKYYIPSHLSHVRIIYWQRNELVCTIWICHCINCTHSKMLLSII